MDPPTPFSVAGAQVQDRCRALGAVRLAPSHAPSVTPVDVFGATVAEDGVEKSVFGATEKATKSRDTATASASKTATLAMGGPILAAAAINPVKSFVAPVMDVPD